MWIAIYTLLRIIAPFHTVLSWLLSGWLILTGIAAIFFGSFHTAALAAVIVFALQLLRTNFTRWLEASKARVEARKKVEA